MDEHDPYRVALLIVLGCGEAEPGPDDQQHGGHRPQHRRQRAGETQEAVGIGEAEHRRLLSGPGRRAPYGDFTGWRRDAGAVLGRCHSDPKASAMTDDVTRDSNGNILADGDSVTLIKDLKVKGSGGVTLKRGTLVKNIRLTGDTDEIEANVDKVRGLVLRVEFVKKA